MGVYQSIPVECTSRADARPLSWWLQAAAVLSAAFCLHWICWSQIPPDMVQFLFPWYDHILAKGPIGAFTEPFSNYTPTYLYLLAGASLADPALGPLNVIKLLSVLGTAFLSWSVADLLKAMGRDTRGAMFVFLLPSAILNAALLGQCDAFWAGA